jgi:hypothetical protein
MSRARLTVIVRGVAIGGECTRRSVVDMDHPDADTALVPALLRSRLALVALFVVFLIPVTQSVPAGPDARAQCTERVDTPVPGDPPRGRGADRDGVVVITADEPTTLCGGLAVQIGAGPSESADIDVIVTSPTSRSTIGSAPSNSTWSECGFRSTSVASMPGPPRSAGSRCACPTASPSSAGRFSSDRDDPSDLYARIVILHVSGPSNAGPGEREAMLSRAKEFLAGAGVDESSAWMCRAEAAARREPDPFGPRSSRPSRCSSRHRCSAGSPVWRSSTPTSSTPTRRRCSPTWWRRWMRTRSHSSSSRRAQCRPRWQRC